MWDYALWGSKNRAHMCSPNYISLGRGWFLICISALNMKVSLEAISLPASSTPHTRKSRWCSHNRRQFHQISAAYLKPTTCDKKERTNERIKGLCHLEVKRSRNCLQCEVRKRWCLQFNAKYCWDQDCYYFLSNDSPTWEKQGSLLLAKPIKMIISPDNVAWATINYIFQIRG